MARTVVGLDIGSSGVRAVELTLGRTPKVRRTASAALPRGAVRAGAVVDSEAVSLALRQMWDGAKFSTRDVVFGVANDGVLVRQMDVAWMPPAELAKALRYQVADSIPMPVEAANIDSHVLGEFETTDDSGATQRMLRLLLVVASGDMVEGFLAALRGARLRPVKAELVPFALVRAAFRPPAPDAVAAVEAMVDLGAQTISVVVHESGQPRFVRMVSDHGGDRVTAALAERFGWSHDEAEIAKLEASARPDKGLDLDSEWGQHEQVRAVVESEVAALVDEVVTTLDYFLGSSPEVTGFARVVLVGDAARAPGLLERLSAELGVAVERGADARPEVSGAPTDLTLPYGLAMAVA